MPWRPRWTLCAALALGAGFPAVTGGCEPQRAAVGEPRLGTSESAIGGGPWQEISPGPLPSARYAPGADYDPVSGLTLVFGGAGTSGALADLWGWDGGTWSELCAGGAICNAPNARQEMSMVLDSARQRSVTFSGSDGMFPPGYPTDTWEWDGAKWIQMCTTPPCSATVPQPRSDYGLAYDPDRHLTVLFGGGYINGAFQLINLGDTWEWDGGSWNQRCASCAPGARNGPAMSFDGATGKVMLFGGNNGSYLSDTWEWDGMTWQLLTPSMAPPPRANAALSYDSQRKRTVLYGGGTPSNVPAADTWEWDGQNWSIVSPSMGPGSRFAAAMAFDSARAKTVLFGGSDGGTGAATAYGDTWEYQGTCAGCLSVNGCQLGNDNAACGNGGSVCASCPAITVCLNGACVVPIGDAGLDAGSDAGSDAGAGSDGGPDAGSDAGGSDSGTADGGRSDSGHPEDGGDAGGHGQPGALGVGCGCGGGSSPKVALGLALLALGSRRRKPGNHRLGA